MTGSQWLYVHVYLMRENSIHMIDFQKKTYTYKKANVVDLVKTFVCFFFQWEDIFQLQWKLCTKLRVCKRCWCIYKPWQELGKGSLMNTTLIPQSHFRSLHVCTKSKYVQMLLVLICLWKIFEILKRIWKSLNRTLANRKKDSWIDCFFVQNEIVLLISRMRRQNGFNTVSGFFLYFGYRSLCVTLCVFI